MEGLPYRDGTYAALFRVDPASPAPEEEGIHEVPDLKTCLKYLI
jgi:hypothetical protein